MRVLVVNTSDIEGGAARAAYRLHCALLAEGVDSQMLVQHKVSDGFTIIGPLTKSQKSFRKLRPILDRLRVKPYKDNKSLFSPAWVPYSSIADQINELAPDVVHLHWVAGGMIRVEDIARIKAPIVWSLHDMWPFTGGCHYDENCGAFKNNCGSCKVLVSTEDNDLSRKVFLRKQKTFSQKKDIVVIGLSRWLASEAKASSLFSSYPVVNLPNPIDTQAFAPFDRKQARSLFNLPLDKKLILFGAIGATSDPRKGFLELSQALAQLETANVELVVFGASQPEQGAVFTQKVHYLGRLHDDVTLRALYSAADVMLVPSLQENLSNAIMESLACGTPVVGFDIGGNSDLVDHKASGYLAEPFSIDDLAKGISWILDHQDAGAISAAARQKVMREFEQSHVTAQYIKLYEKMLAN